MCATISVTSRVALTGIGLTAAMTAVVVRTTTSTVTTVVTTATDTTVTATTIMMIADVVTIGDARFS